MSCAVALIALSVGYLVYLHACKEKEGIKLLGQVIGIFVMIMAVAAFTCATAKCMKRYGCLKGKNDCPTMSSKAPMCPVGGKMEQESQE